MIITLEVPHQGRPRCWFAFDEDDFIRKTTLALQETTANGVIYAQSTPNQLLTKQGLVPDAANLRDQHPDIVALADQHGWDTPLYRADYLLAPGHYQREEVPEFVAHVAALACTLQLCRVYFDEQQALQALEQDELYRDKAGFFHHMALRNQLIALEVLADDL